MNSSVLPPDLPLGAPSAPMAGARVDAGAPAVAWSAVFAGAAAAAALSMILLILGVGLGLSTVSPWAASGLSATAFGMSTIAWLSFTQLAASGMGGYLAGRLRHRWLRTDPDEVYFRDTAHGFLSWAVASLVTAAALSSAVGAIVGGGVQAGAAVAGAAGTAVAAGAGGLASAAGTAGDTAGGGSAAYFADLLFRRAASGPQAGAAPAPDAAASAGGVAPPAEPSPAAVGSAPPALSPASLAEAARIMAQGVSSGVLPAEDARYLAEMVAQRTGLSQAEAERRVNETFTRLKARADEAATAAREAADTARKASAYAALWLFVSLLLGAFVASYAALHGGRRRDLV